MGPKYILDANLIVLFAVGLVDARRVPSHKRLKSYRPEDFYLLEIILSKASKITSLPNAWTEASNLLGPSGEDTRQAKIIAIFQKLVAAWGCIYVPSDVAVTRSEFRFLGLTDSALLELAKADFTILSADAKLCLAAWNAGLKASNFNDLRSL